MRNRAFFYFFTAYVYLRLRGEQSYWLLLPKVALHLHKVEGF